MNAPNYAQIETIVQQLVSKIENVNAAIPTQYDSVNTDSDTGLLKQVAEGTEPYNHLAIKGVNVLIDKINDLTTRVAALEKAASN